MNSKHENTCGREVAGYFAWQDAEVVNNERLKPYNYTYLATKRV